MTNAHVEKNAFTNYPIKACLSSTDNIDLSCTYTMQSCSDIGYDACLATISADTNANAADCVTNPYQTKICCKTACKSASETNCGDGIDNDCDNLIDCNDADCGGSIAGAVKNLNAQGISSADVSAKKGLTTIASATTNQQGGYSIAQINCGTYNLVASHPDYAPATMTISPQSGQQLTADFSLVLGTSCEQDCTFASDNIVHASCDGKNGCAFYDSIAKAACDNSQPGWVRDYDSSHYVVCASGAPQSKLEIKASVSCASGTLVKVTRIVVHNGKPVRLVVATCG